MCSVPSLAQMAERLIVGVKHKQKYQLVTGSIPVARKLSILTAN